MYGTQKFCKDKPVNIVAAGELRDLYVKFVSEAKNTGIVECAVRCGARGEFVFFKFGKLDFVSK
jgi:hypothetical protein